MRFVVGLLFAVVMGLIGGLLFKMRRGGERNRLRKQLGARGATVSDDGGALEVSQTVHALLAGREPRWSARLSGEPALNFYQIAEAPIVLAWRSARELNAGF